MKSIISTVYLMTCPYVSDSPIRAAAPAPVRTSRYTAPRQTAPRPHPRPPAHCRPHARVQDTWRRFPSPSCSPSPTLLACAAPPAARSLTPSLALPSPPGTGRFLM